MRAKQSPPGDSTAAQPKPADTSADLEMVFLDDERKPTSASSKAKMVESDRSGIARAAAVTTKAKEQRGGMRRRRVSCRA